jgi:hypothetical protein
MEGPSSSNARTYWVIIGLSALLMFSWMMTGNFFLTLAVLILGSLHLAREFPEAEALISADPLLLWTRRLSPLIVLGIFGIVFVGNWYR